MSDYIGPLYECLHQVVTQRSDVPRTFLAIPVTLAQPKQCFVCTKFAQNKGKTLCSLIVFTQLFRQEINNAVFFAQFT